MKLAADGGLGHNALGDQKHSGGVFTQPVDESEPLRIREDFADLRPEVAPQPINERWAAVPGRRMDYQPGRLVQSQEHLILEKNCRNNSGLKRTTGLRPGQALDR